MLHFLFLLSILVFLIFYSNLFTLGYHVFLTKRKVFGDASLTVFVSFALSISTIILLLILPKFTVNTYAVSVGLLILGIVVHGVYCVKNRKKIKDTWNTITTTLAKEKVVILFFLASILLLIIPAIHHYWYFGYGVDWIQHSSLSHYHFMQDQDTFYPALGPHAFLSILDLVGFVYPAIFQMGIAYLLSLSILPFYFLAKRFLNTPGVIIALLLWLILPYHYELYGELVPNASSVFFYLTFFLLIVNILERGLTKGFTHTNLLSAIGVILLSASIYNHQVFLYPYFFIYVLITILYIAFSHQKVAHIKGLLGVYSKILIGTAIILSPFLKVLYDGAKQVMNIHSGYEAPYSFYEFILMLYGHTGFIMFALGLIGTGMYVLRKVKKKKTGDGLSKIVLFSLIVGTLITVNLYFDGNPYWSNRSFYLLDVFIALPVAYLLSVIITKRPAVLWRNGCYLVLIIMLLTKVDYYITIDPIWSQEMQSAIEWSEEHVDFLETKKVSLVFHDTKGANRIFQKSFGRNSDLPIWLVSKEEYRDLRIDDVGEVILDTNAYRIMEDDDNVYFDFKLEVLQAHDYLHNSQKPQTIPRQKYTLDRILRDHFFVHAIVDQSVKKGGKGIKIRPGRDVSQSFIAKTSVVSDICLSLSKARESDTAIYLKLFTSGDNTPLTVTHLSEREMNKIPIGSYEEVCFSVDQDLTPGESYIFEVDTKAHADYAVLNTGQDGYFFGTAYFNNQPVDDDLLFRIKKFQFFTWEYPGK